MRRKMGKSDEWCLENNQRISGWLGREMEARNLEESEIERRKMNLKAVEQLPDSVVHLTYLTKKKLD